MRTESEIQKQTMAAKQQLNRQRSRNRHHHRHQQPYQQYKTIEMNVRVCARGSSR